MAKFKDQYYLNSFTEKEALGWFKDEEDTKMFMSSVGVIFLSKVRTLEELKETNGLTDLGLSRLGSMLKRKYLLWCNLTIVEMADLTAEEFLAAIDHEKGHMLNNDLDFIGLVSALSPLEVEIRADAYSVSLGNDPRTLISLLNKTVWGMCEYRKSIGGLEGKEVDEAAKEFYSSDMYKLRVEALEKLIK